MAMPHNGVVRVVPLVWRMLVQSTGSDTAWREYFLDTPDLAEWGPYLAGITVHAGTESTTANVEWKVVVFWSLDGSPWEGPYNLTTVMNAGSAGQVIHAEFTDKTKLGLKLRLAVAVKNVTGQSGALESAIVTAAAACRFRT